MPPCVVTPRIRVAYVFTNGDSRFQVQRASPFTCA